jgi:hypothetical protein
MFRTESRLTSRSLRTGCPELASAPFGLIGSMRIEIPSDFGVHDEEQSPL